MKVKEIYLFMSPHGPANTGGEHKNVAKLCYLSHKQYQKDMVAVGSFPLPNKSSTEQQRMAKCQWDPGCG